MIGTKASWENWLWRIRMTLLVSIIVAIAVAGISASRYQSGAGQGWFYPWLSSTVLLKSGITWGGLGLNSATAQPHREFLYSFCGKYPATCEEFQQKARRFFVTFPAIAAGAIWGGFLLLAAALRSRKENEEHRRGSLVVDAKTLRRKLRGEPAQIVLGGVPFPRQDETRHLLFAGSPGSGKTVAFNTVLKAIRARGDRAVVIDAGGAFLSRFARKGDALLNSFDRRGKPWSPFAEGASAWEIEAMARSLIPPGEGSNKNWQDLAKTVLAGLIEQCRHHGIATNHALATLATSSNPELLAKILAGHPACGLVASGSPSTVGSIMTNLGEAASGLRYLQPEAGAAGFSIGDWVRNGDGWLFLSFQISQRESLKHILAAQLDVVARTVLDLPPDEQRRIWLIVDELPLLGKVHSIVEYLTNGRRFGACAVLGIQAISQLREAYGREGAQTMLSCLSSQLVLRSADGETAEQMSRLLGEREILRRTHSQGKNEHGRSLNESEQIATTRAVMAAEIQGLADLHGYFSLIGDRPIAKIKLNIPELPDPCNQAFVPRQMPPRQPLILPAHLQGGEADMPLAEVPPSNAADDDDWRTAAQEV